MKFAILLLALAILIGQSIAAETKIAPNRLALTENFGGQLKGITAGTSTGDAANMGQLWAKINKSGDTMSGALAMGGYKITGMDDGESSQDAVTFGQLNAASLNDFRVIIVCDSGSYQVTFSNGTVIYSGSSATTALAWAINNLTSGRTWIESVKIDGVLDGIAYVNLPSNTSVYGGKIVSEDSSTAIFTNTGDTKNVYIHDTIIHRTGSGYVDIGSGGGALDHLLVERVVFENCQIVNSNVGNRNIRYSNCNFLRTGTGSVADFLGINGKNIYVEKCNFTNFASTGASLLTSGGCDGFHVTDNIFRHEQSVHDAVSLESLDFMDGCVYNISNVSIFANTMINAWVKCGHYGAMPPRGNSILIKDNRITGGVSIVGETDNVKIVGNDIDLGSIILDCYELDESISNVLIEGNSVNCSTPNAALIMWAGTGGSINNITAVHNTFIRYTT